MDKHFQEELHLSLAQSAWVQFAHYLGYFRMALPAGWLATKARHLWLGPAGQESLVVRCHGDHGRRHSAQGDGKVADKYDLSRGFIVPMLGFAFVAAYAFFWPKLSGAEGVTGVATSGGH